MDGLAERSGKGMERIADKKISGEERENVRTKGIDFAAGSDDHRPNRP